MYVNVHQSDNVLFVEPKYKNFKEEIFEYKQIDIDQYKQEILPKVNVFHSTDLAKSMVARDRGRSLEQYDVFDGDMISKDSLMSMVLYTDYTELSSVFSSTFRKKNMFEPLSSTKKRHTNFYWMSRFLRRTVAIYGYNNYKEYQKYASYPPTTTQEKLGGPFFCGMSMLMTMPQFAMRIFSPTSTSCQIAVAIKFAGDKGVIIEFMTSIESNAQELRGLDLSWISRYKEEDERYEIFLSFQIQ